MAKGRKSGRMLPQRRRAVACFTALALAALVALDLAARASFVPAVAFQREVRVCPTETDACRCALCVVPGLRVDVSRV